MKILLAPAILLLLFLTTTCKKNNPDKPFDFTVTNTWECIVDGVLYSGTIDTSFMEIWFDQYGIGDTTIYCTGTSVDKRANMHFQLRVNRTGWRHDSVMTQLGSEFNFDTSSSNHLRAWSNLGGITFHIDSLNGYKFKGRFSGTAFALQGGGNRTVTNGKFSFQIGKGDNEPKFLSCAADNIPIRGWVSNAKLISNTLIIEGLGFHADSTFQLMVRTGSQLKTGVFKSQDGDVGFQAYRPSTVTDYVSDAVGDLTVTIQSVSGNIVEGIFSGMAQSFYPNPTATITNGKFQCRVKNYIAQQDSVNKWGFSESNGLQYPYHTWGGNIFNATRSQNGSSYYVIVNGESDNGNSNFRIKLRSASPLAAGLYESGSNYPNNLDSFYFYCNPLNITYYQPSFQGLACQVDTIDNQHIVGHFYGTAFSGQSLRRGYFRAKF